MKLLRIKDNSRSQKSFFSPIEHLTVKIADKTLEQLEREGVFVFPGNLQRMEDLTGEQMILQGINDAYQTGNVMGFLGWGGERLIIESRFCGEEGGLLIPISSGTGGWHPQSGEPQIRYQSGKQIVPCSPFSVSSLFESCYAKGDLQTVYFSGVQR